MTDARTDNWAKGANNLAKPERLPAGFVRDLVNLEPSEGGQLELRGGFGKVVTGTDMRLGVALPGKVIYVDGGSVGCYLPEDDSSSIIGSVSALGEIAGVALNGQAYISTPHGSVRTDGTKVSAWGIDAPGFEVDVIAGSLPAGIYKVAATALGADGEESGADPKIIRVAEGQALRVRSTDSRSLTLYASVANGSTLYSQGPMIGGAIALTKIDDHRERLTTDGLVPLPPCTMLAAYHSVILGVYGNCVVFTSPMYPHLMDPVTGFFQYSEAPDVIAVTDGGVYVVAGEKTYFITGLEGSDTIQRTVMEIGAVKGAAVSLPDGRAAWFTRYGQAIGDSSGAVSLPNRQSYAPDIAAFGAAGLLERGGNSMVVTTMRGAVKPNNLSTGDFADLEIADAP